MRSLIVLVLLVLAPVLRASPFLDLPTLSPTSDAIYAQDTSGSQFGTADYTFTRWDDGSFDLSSVSGGDGWSVYTDSHHRFDWNQFCNDRNVLVRWGQFGNWHKSWSWDCPDTTSNPPGGGGTSPVPDGNNVVLLLGTAMVALAAMKRVLPEIPLG